MRELEAYIELEHKFTVSGLTFVVEAGSEVRVFEYRLNARLRLAALRLAAEKLIQRSKR